MTPCRTTPSLPAVLALVLPALALVPACGGSAVPEMICGDSDVGEVGPNNDLPMAPIVTFGKTLRGCVDVVGDRDFYVFNSPGKAAGGYATFELTNLGTSQIRAAFFIAAGQGLMKEMSSEAGKPLSGYAAMVPATSYAIRVSHGAITFDKGYAYALVLKWNEAPDSHEPNDFQADAKAISRDQTVKGKMFAGYQQMQIPSMSVSAPGPAAYDDWFKVTLAAGDVTVQFVDVAANLAIRAELKGADGKELLCARGCFGDPGQGVDMVAAGVTAGPYLLKVTRQPVPGLEPAGAGAPPENFTKDYLLKVTQ